MYTVNELINKLIKKIEEGYVPVAHSLTQKDKYITIYNTTINENGYFKFNYCNEDGCLLTDYLPYRSSIYPVNHYVWKIYKKKDISISDDKSIDEFEKDNSDNNFKNQNVEIENLKKEINFYKKLLKDNNISIPKGINKKTIGIDFDGTLVTNIYPDLGTLKPNAQETCQKIIDSGNEIVIWTCREPEAIRKFLLYNNIPFTTINENTESLINRWGNNPRKAGVDLFIDDKNIFCNEINWFEIEKELMRLGYITE